MPAPTSEAAGRGGESLTRAYWTYKVDSMTGPVAQFRMAQLVDYDLRLTDPARTVYRFMIGWYMHAKYGDALASVRHIVKTMRDRAPDGARHLSRSAVQRAIMLLIKCGWLVRTHTGKGRGGSRYVPVLNVLELAAQGTLPISVPDHRDATEIPLVSHSTGTAVSHSTGTQSDLASHVTGTKTLLLDPPTDGSTEREIDPATPTAPPLADGLAATAAGGTAVEERARSHADDIQAAQAKLTFELCYRTYDYAKGKKEARAAWDALPAEVDRAAVIKAAAAWQASWEAQGKPDAPRKHLATWLREERYDEDAPTGYQPKEKAKAKSGPQKSANPAEPVSQKSDARATAKPAKRQPAAPITARVTASEVVKVEGLSELLFTATDEAGVEHEHVITLEHPDMETQFEGQRQLAKLVHAAGLEQIQDSSELHDRTIVITENGFAEPDTRPDDEPPIAVKPEPVKYANPPSEPWTEADQARVKQWVASLPSVRSRYRTSDECRAQLDAEADEEFQRDAANDDWPAWMDDEYDDEAA